MSAGKTGIMLHYLPPLPGRIILLLLAIQLSSCWSLVKKPVDDPSYNVDVEREEAYVPIYDSTECRLVASHPPKAIDKAGKIYVLGNYLFQVEKLAGVHVIDYTDRTKPVKLGFIQSYGCSEVAAKGAYLIINNLDDLVTVDISNVNNVREVARISKAFLQYRVDGYTQFLPPPERGKYFICPDFTKGTVIGWKLEKKVKNAFCFN